MVYVNENFFDNCDVLYFAEEVLKMLSNGDVFKKLKLFVQVYRLNNCGYKWLLTNFQNDQDYIFQDDNQTD